MGFLIIRDEGDPYGQVVLVSFYSKLIPFDDYMCGILGRVNNL